MKLVRESINEIKTNKESGLSAIGVGDVNLNKAYKYILKRCGDTYNELFKLLSYCIEYNKPALSKYSAIIKEVTKVLNTDHDHILYTISNNTKRNYIQRWLLHNTLTSKDINKYNLNNSTFTYTVIHHSELLGTVLASIYKLDKTGTSTILHTLYFVRF